MRRFVCALAFAAVASFAQAQSPVTQQSNADPFTWLEEVEGERALAQVRTWNDRSLKVLQADPRYADLHAKALEIVNAQDRIPMPAIRGDRVDNFWQDKTNVRGLWRRTSLTGYAAAQPRWETVLDVDALSRAENANWVYKGARCLEPDQTRCLVDLSNGGKDAVEIREFDVAARSFVPNGFKLPEGKQRVTWRDQDTLYVARDWGAGTMTASGYPFIVKAVKRGQPLDQAQEVFRGAQSDGGYGVYPLVLRDPAGELKGVMFLRPLNTFDSEHYLLTDRGTVKLPLPVKATFQAYVDGQAVFTLEEAWRHGAQQFATGSLISFDLAELQKNPASAKATLIRQPGARESIEQVANTRSRLLVAVYENVRGALYGYRRQNGRWTPTRYDLPENASVGVVTASEDDDTAFVSVSGFLQPTSLYQGDAASGAFKLVKQLPPKFDSANMAVDQFEAVSKDGTKIPYFVVHRRDMAMNGANPTLLYAYGGFQVSMTPSYSAMAGKLWVERGGVYVLANIRGGGEFGPAWHQAGLKENRQRVYDDFAAVSRNLVARKITSPEKLGIQGGSNGGLLMGVAFTQNPDLYRGVIIDVPLLDMLRYNKLLAGASWMGEYGDPDVPAEAAYIRTYSPYQNLRPGREYPEPFIVTSTKDDRVHPGHARKFAAKLEQMGVPFLYYENIDGGHSAAANLQETAKRVALEYTYLSRKLMGEAQSAD